MFFNRIHSSRTRGALLLVLFSISIATCTPTRGDEVESKKQQWKFSVRFSKDVHAQPFSGRVYVFFSRSNREPRLGPSWMRPEIFVARDVTNLKPGELVTFSSKATDGDLAYPKPLAEVDLTGYRGQAVIRFNPIDREIGRGTGNGYSTVQLVEDNSPIEFEVANLVKAGRFTDSKWSKLLEVRSKLLSEFHGREVSLRAAVVLPASYYSKPDQRYPVIFSIPGFGGTHFSGQRRSPIREQNDQGVEFLRVMLDASCQLGHHVFADSANNGPVGQALVTELIPELNRRFRSIDAPTARFLTGHSSGGWSSLWLQVTYPETFGGTWSTAPDVVDFRDYQQVNLYQSGSNIYVDENGQERPIARRNGRVLLWYRGFSKMEWVLGHGGQLHSFEAVFSPRGPDGKPLLLFDRETGAINLKVAKSWEKYDIRMILERNIKTLGPKLRGKVHVFMGDVDTFYLDGATKLLKKSLKALDSDAVVEIHPGKDHMSLMTRQLAGRIQREMVTSFLKHHSEAGDE